MIFVPDNAVVLASIALTDLIHGPENAALLKKWVEYNRKFNVHANGLLYPWISSAGQGYGIPRGSYAAWNSIFLPLVDREFAAEQFRALKDQYVVSLPGGAAGLREYPRGVRGSGDIDSGPVIFGLSTSGTGFAAAGARFAGDARLLDGLLRTAEGVGSSWDSSAGRRYLLGPLVGDAIMLEAKTARLWDRRYLETVS